MLQAAFSDQGRAAEIAWAVGVPWQGHGIASEAARALVGWLERRGVATITAHIPPTIAPARRWRRRGRGTAGHIE
jgi:RimJ/RimL family protein N-acetyltransferase